MSTKPIIDYTQCGDIVCHDLPLIYNSKKDFDKLLYRSNGVANAMIQALRDLTEDLEGSDPMIIADLVFFGFLRFIAGLTTSELLKEHNVVIKKIMIDFLIDKLSNLNDQIDVVEYCEDSDS